MSKFVHVVLALFLAVAPVVAFAEPSKAPVASRDDAPAGARVRLEVLSVHATTTGQVDPRLREIQRQLPPMFTGLQLLSTHTDQVGLNQAMSFAVEGGRRMKITLLSRDPQQARVRIELFKDDEKKVDTTVSLRPGRAFTFGGFPYQEGKLILPVTVTY